MSAVFRIFLHIYGFVFLAVTAVCTNVMWCGTMAMHRRAVDKPSSSEFSGHKLHKLHKLPAFRQQKQAKRGVVALILPLAGAAVPYTFRAVHTTLIRPSRTLSHRLKSATLPYTRDTTYSYTA